MNYKLQDLIDVKHFQRLQDRLNEIYSFPSSIIDNDGNILTATTWQDVCTQFHRKNKETEVTCIKSDQYILDHIQEANPAVTYRCPYGLVDNATPIIIDNVHYGNFFTGQFFLKEPDLKFFSDQAKKYGFDEKAYIDAVKRVPVWSQKQLDNYLYFIKGLIEVIAESGLKALKEIENKNKLEKSEERFRNISNHIPGMLYQFVMHPDGRYSIPYVSDKVQNFLGYSPDQIIAQPQLFFSAVHPDDVACLNDAVQESARTLSEFEMEIRLMTRKNEAKWFVFRSSPVLMDNGDTFWNGLSIDITEQKQVADELKETESNYRIMAEMLDEAPNSITIHDPSGNYFYANRKTFEIHGYPPEEFMKLNLYDVNVPEHERLIEQRLQLIMDNGEASFTSAHFRKDGSIVPVEVFGKLVDWKNQPAMINIATDITQRMTAEKELRESRGNLMALIENTDDIIVSRDLKDRAIVYNQAFVRVVKELFGIQATPGIHTLDYLPPDKREHWEEILSKVKKGFNVQEEYAWEVDGEQRWFESAHNPIKVDDRIIGAAEFTRDITRRKLADKEATDMADHLKLATSAARLGIWDWDIGRNKLIWDDGMFALYGIQKGGFENRYESWLDCIYSEDRKKVDNMVLAAREGKREYDTEFRIIWPDGTIKHIKAIGQVFWDAKKRPTRMMGVNLDITEKKEMENRLQQAQKMEAIGTLAGGIAHDFNNILFPIVGISELMMEECPKDSPLHDNLSQILRAGKRGSELVKQILSFSRQTDHQVMPMRLHHVLKEVLKLVRQTIPANIKIKQNIQNQCGMVNADPTQIHQVAMNLITNAYHALGSTGGEIGVALLETEIDDKRNSFMDMKPGKYATLTVSDTGSGMPPELMEKVFEPYFTTKEQGKGTGLGLAVVHGIIKEHHGEIKVYSEYGKGTVFYVYLPIIKGETSEEKNIPKVIDPTGNEKILLVDDEAAIVKLEKQILERLGYRVTEYTSSPDALGAFSEKPYAYDLLITDMTMPDMTGDILARECNAIRPDMPVIICTGFTEHLDLKSGLANIKGILMKPIVKNKLAKTIRAVLDASKSTIYSDSE